MKSFSFKTLKVDGVKSFNYLAGINRPIAPSQVTTLAKSIEKIGITRPVVVTKISFITGKPLKYIIDGQHLFNACIRIGCDVPYTEIEVKDKKDLVQKIALLNSSSRSWTILDYVTAWASLVPDYVKLNHYFQVYDIELSAIAAILSEDLLTSGAGVGRKIKNGSFKILNEKENVRIIDHLTDVLKIIPRMNRFENRYTCSEYVKFLRTTPKYDHNKFLAKLEKNKEKFILATQEPKLLSDLFKNL